MLRESQNFLFDFMSNPRVVAAFKKDRPRVLRKYFRDEKDRAALSKLPFERFETYRRHVSVGLLGGVEDAFPVLRSLVSGREWTGLLDGFYLRGLARSPLARHVYGEFARYLGKYKGPLSARLPYLKELAEYEHLELKLFYDIDRPVGDFDVEDLESVRDPGALLRLAPVLNPHHALRVYRWPVHRICREFSSAKKVRPGRYPLLVYRDPETLTVRFMEANPLAAELLNRIEAGRVSVKELLEFLLRRRKPLDVETFVAEAIRTLSWLAAKGVLSGFVQTGDQ